VKYEQTQYVISAHDIHEIRRDDSSLSESVRQKSTSILLCSDLHILFCENSYDW